MTPYIRKIVFYKLYIWHLFLDFFFSVSFSFPFFFPFFFFFSFLFLQNSAKLQCGSRRFANPNKKSLYLTAFFIHWKQLGTLGFCVDGKSSHFIVFSIFFVSLKHYLAQRELTFRTFKSCLTYVLQKKAAKENLEFRVKLFAKQHL